MVRNFFRREIRIHAQRLGNNYKEQARISASTEAERKISPLAKRGEYISTDRK